MAARQTPNKALLKHEWPGEHSALELAQGAFPSCNFISVPLQICVWLQNCIICHLPSCYPANLFFAHRFAWLPNKSTGMGRGKGKFARSSQFLLGLKLPASPNIQRKSQASELHWIGPLHGSVFTPPSPFSGNYVCFSGSWFLNLVPSPPRVCNKASLSFGFSLSVLIFSQRCPGISGFSPRWVTSEYELQKAANVIPQILNVGRLWRLLAAHSLGLVFFHYADDKR